MDEKLIVVFRAYGRRCRRLTRTLKSKGKRHNQQKPKIIVHIHRHTFSHHAVAPIRTRGYKGCGRRTSRSLPLKTNIVNTDAARHAAPRSCATFTIRRTATRRGAARCLRRFVNTQPRTNRAARIDPSSKLAARCGAADAARPIK